MLRVFLISIFFTSSLFASFKDGIVAYDNGDYNNAKKIFLEIKKDDSKESRLANFLLACIASHEGDKKLAKERFNISFKNPPEKNEIVLASKFSEFTTANNLYEYQVELLTPYLEKYKECLKKDPMIAWRYAVALYKIGKIEKSEKVFKAIWDDNGNSQNSVTDMFLFNPDYSKFLKDERSKDNTLSSLRLNLIFKRTDLSNIKNFKDLSFGMLIYLAENGVKIPEEIFESKIEQEQNLFFVQKYYEYLAKIYFGEKNYDLAIIFADKYIDGTLGDITKSAKMYILKGDSLRLEKKYNEALDSYMKVVHSKECGGELAAESIYKCGVTHYEMEEWQLAYDYFERVFVVYGMYDYWSSRAYLYGAKAILKKGNIQGAKNVLREYLKLSKHRDTIIFNQAAVLYSELR